MKREIKFRCFYRGKMYEVKELQGGAVGLIEMEINGELWPVSPDSEHVKGIMQFTGLKDKNGKEIYEGDIWKRDDYLGEIVFEFSHWNIKTVKSSGSYQYPAFYSNAITGEVIGNIYENPDLIKEAN
jgi:uncharacterized phage protein (TIGR01671 family)